MKRLTSEFKEFAEYTGMILTVFFTTVTIGLTVATIYVIAKFIFEVLR